MKPKRLYCQPHRRTVSVMTLDAGLCRVEIEAKDGFTFEKFEAAYDAEHDCVRVLMRVKRPAAKRAA